MEKTMPCDTEYAPSVIPRPGLKRESTDSDPALFRHKRYASRLRCGRGLIDEQGVSFARSQALAAQAGPTAESDGAR
jgi:hypothetical protein